MKDGVANRIAGLEARIGYVFSDTSLAARALTHSSYGDGRLKTGNNERLEFLGDRVLGLMTAERLYSQREISEGAMARRLNALVRKETCAKVAREIGLGDALLISPSEARAGGREKLSILGDALEALIAALYLDGGWDAVQPFFDRFWPAEPEAVTAKDPKTRLQERAAPHGVQPVYDVVERSGPDHKPLFVVEVSVTGFGSARGTGKSKKIAERFAATHLLDTWKT